MPARVLVADDSSRIRLLIRITLQATDYVLMEATNGNEALDLILKHRPDIAILDISMPVSDDLKGTRLAINGLDVCRAVRAEPRLRALKIIVISTMVSNSEALSAGADRFLEKPFRPKELLATIDELLSGRFDRANATASARPRRSS